MDISDYNNRLAETRERYNQKSDELRHNYESDKKILEGTHQARENSQRQVYNDSREALENTLQNVTERQSEKSKDEIQRQQADYNKQLNAARKQFEQQTIADRNKFSERLNSLKENFDRNGRLREVPTNQKYDGTTTRLQDTITKDRRDHAREMQTVIDDNNNNFQEYRKKMAADRQALVRQEEEKTHDVVRQGTLEQAKLNNTMTNEIKGLNRAHEAELAQMRMDQQDQLAQVHSLHEAHDQGMINNYDHLMDANQQLNNNEKRGLIVSNNEKMRARDKEYNKELNALERRSLAIANNGGRGDEARKELERVKRVDEDRIAHMKNNLENAKVALTDDKAKMMDDAQNTLRQQALNHYQDQDSKDKQFVIDRANQTEKVGREREQITETFTNELKGHKESSAKALAESRASDKSKYNALRDDYSRRMNLMSEKNLQTIASLKQEQMRDKTAFIEGAKRDVFETKSQMKDEVYNRLQREAEVHQTKVSTLESEKEKLISNYEDRLMNLSKKTVSNDQQHTLVEELRRREDMRTAKKIQENKDFETGKVIQSLRKEFDKNINEIGHLSELKVNRLNKQYEDVISRMTKENNIVLHRRDAQARDNYDRLVKINELEKEELANKYEVKLQKMRDALERAREVTALRNEASKNSKIDPDDIA